MKMNKGKIKVLFEKRKTRHDYIKISWELERT